MPQTRNETSRDLRRVAYTVLILTTTAMMIGRVTTVKSQLGRTPLLGANDRSRWSTVRSLVDHGTYRLDDVLFQKSGARDREWYSIDLVRHKGSDGREHYYSSKPPLLPTLVAGKYWLLKTLTGATLARQSFYIVRLLLVTTNVLPLVLYFLLLAQLLERMEASTWARIFVMAAATYGTFLTPLAVTLNNHLPAAISALITVHAVLSIWGTGEPRLWRFALAGAAAAFTAGNELPALAFSVLVAGALLVKFPRQTLVGFVPAAALVAAAFVGTNYLAHESWRPPYAHRSDGPVIAAVSATDAVVSSDGRLDGELRKAIAIAGVPLSAETTVTSSPRANRWIVWDPQHQSRYALVTADGKLQLREWDDWYEYEDSYWTPDRLRGVDRGEPSRAVYAFHVLGGHHGVFSLTPIWLLSVLGMGLWIAGRDRTLRAFALVAAVTAVTCLAFYILRPLEDRNYGGVCSGFRWMFWFTPLWLLSLLPAADFISRSHIGRWVGWAMLFVSVFSAAYGSVNPWSHPWLFDYWSYVGWIKY